MQLPRIKTYPPHFDSLLSRSQALSLVSKSANIISHPFFPFLQRDQRWTKFSKSNSVPDVKTRHIRYASRRDSYIFSHYRSILYPLYENQIQNLGISESVLAYRRITQKNSNSGKCNIHFAYEAFKYIQQLDDCTVFAFDVKDFFESLDHEHIKNMWIRLLESGVMAANKKLPDDHYKVFNAVTQYSYIDIQVAYKELGYIGEIIELSGKAKIKYLTARKDIPLQICSPSEFRNKLTPHIIKNSNPYGIPQGSPISDLIANLYMMDFDCAMREYVNTHGGAYYRYSDDILIILPTVHVQWNAVVIETEKNLQKLAPRLLLKQKKTQIYRYIKQSNAAQACSVIESENNSQGLEYLGFRYDGKRIFLRNSTISGIRRKISMSAKCMAIRHLKNNPTYDLESLIESFNYDRLIYKFGRTKKFDSSEKKYSEWTFWTYVKRASEILGLDSTSIMKQVSDYKSVVRKKAKKALQYVDKHRSRYI